MKKLLGPWLLALFFMLLAILLLVFSSGTYDTGDGIFHYLIAHYAFRYPIHFLHHWGKPLFVLLSSPFAFFGFFWINVYNIICNTLSGIIVWKIMRKLEVDDNLSPLIFTWFAPLSFVCMFSGLTEPTFGLVLSAAVLLYIYDKTAWSFLLVSFLPFCRTEGFFILPLFAYAGLRDRRIRLIPLLITGTLVYSFAGYLAYHDFLWIWHQNPYNGENNNYGHGSFFHFFKYNERILGTPLVVLFLAGLTYYVIQFINRKPLVRSEILLIAGSFVTYLMLHVLFWWQGIFGALGLLRVMAAVSPFAAIVCVRGLHFLTSVIANKTLRLVFRNLMLLWVIAVPFLQYGFPLKGNAEENLLKTAASWSKHNLNIQQHKVVIGYPVLFSHLDIDPFDRRASAEINQIDPVHPHYSIKTGTYIFWDSHFGVDNGRERNSFTDNDSLMLIKQFSTVKENGKLFEVIIFQRK